MSVSPRSITSRPILAAPEFKASMISDSDRWKEVARSNGIKLAEYSGQQNGPAGDVASAVNNVSGKRPRRISCPAALTSRLTICIRRRGFGFAALATSATAQTYPGADHSPDRAVRARRWHRSHRAHRRRGSTPSASANRSLSRTSPARRPRSVSTSPPRRSPMATPMMWATSDGMAFSAGAEGRPSPSTWTRISNTSRTTMKYSLVLSANPKLPVKTMAELQAYGKANPGKLHLCRRGHRGRAWSRAHHEGDRRAGHLCALRRFGAERRRRRQRHHRYGAQCARVGQGADPRRSVARDRAYRQRAEPVTSPACRR